MDDRRRLAPVDTHAEVYAHSPRSPAIRRDVVPTWPAPLPSDDRALETMVKRGTTRCVPRKDHRTSRPPPCTGGLAGFWRSYSIATRSSPAEGACPRNEGP
jgi:hypothetical protein